MHWNMEELQPLHQGGVLKTLSFAVGSCAAQCAMWRDELPGTTRSLIPALTLAPPAKARRERCLLQPWMV